jgi:plasmid maintenance system antidote protein VapI
VAFGPTHPRPSARISADTALRLARFFGTSERFWMNLQTQFDLDNEYDRDGERIEREIVPYAVGS